MNEDEQKYDFFARINDEYIRIKELQHVTFEDGIQKLSEINLVQIVRCVDCKHWDGNDGQCPWQMTGDPYLVIHPGADDFCSQGERKKQQGDETLCDEGHW